MHVRDADPCVVRDWHLFVPQLSLHMSQLITKVVECVIKVVKVHVGVAMGLQGSREFSNFGGHFC